MGRYVELNRVRTWFADRGEGDPVMPERRGHGHTPDFEGPLDLD